MECFRMFGFFITLLSVTSLSQGLNCYSCSSTNLLLDEDCSSGSSNIPNITCQPDLNFCVTVKTESTVSRTCWATNSSDGADGDWIFCDYDVCNNNNGTYLQLSILTLIFPLLATYLTFPY